MIILILCTGNSCRSQMAEGFLKFFDSRLGVYSAFIGNVKHRLHIGFDDPADAVGTTEEVMPVYRRVRDEIREGFRTFYTGQIKPEMEK